MKNILWPFLLFSMHLCVFFTLINVAMMRHMNDYFAIKHLVKTMKFLNQSQSLINHPLWYVRRTNCLQKICEIVHVYYNFKPFPPFFIARFFGLVVGENLVYRKNDLTTRPLHFRFPNQYLVQSFIYQNNANTIWTIKAQGIFFNRQKPALTQIHIHTWHIPHSFKQAKPSTHKHTPYITHPSLETRPHQQQNRQDRTETRQNIHSLQLTLLGNAWKNIQFTDKANGEKPYVSVMHKWMEKTGTLQHITCVHCRTHSKDMPCINMWFKKYKTQYQQLSQKKIK